MREKTKCTIDQYFYEPIDNNCAVECTSYKVDFNTIDSIDSLRKYELPQDISKEKVAPRYLSVKTCVFISAICDYLQNNTWMSRKEARLAGDPGLSTAKIVWDNITTNNQGTYDNIFDHLKSWLEKNKTRLATEMYVHQEYLNFREACGIAVIAKIYKEAQESGVSSFIGEIGDEIRERVKVTDIIQKSGFCLLKFQTLQNEVLFCFMGSCLNLKKNSILNIKARVSDFSEYLGQKQTKIKLLKFEEIT